MARKLYKELLELPLGQLLVEPWRNPRKTSGLSPESIRELAHSIKERGQIQPVGVKQHPRAKCHEKCVYDGGHDAGDPLYRVVYGYRRCGAVEQLNLTSVLSLVFEPDVPDEECEFLAVTENVQREDLSDIEQVEAAIYLSKKMGVTVDEYAEKVGLRPGFLNKLVGAYRMLPKEITDEWRNRHPLLTSSIIIKLNDMTSEEALRTWRKGRKQKSLAKAGEALLLSAGKPKNPYRRPSLSKMMALAEKLQEAPLPPLTKQIVEEVLGYCQGISRRPPNFNTLAKTIKASERKGSAHVHAASTTRPPTDR